jgi:hypothetical protein
MNEFESELFDKQEHLGEEFERVLFENIDELLLEDKSEGEG